MTGVLELLLVEDCAGDALLVAEDLRDVAGDGVRLTVAPTIAAAAAALDGVSADCVLLDLSLPDAFGLEGLEALRATHPDLPVVVLSGVVGDELAVRAVQAGAQDCLVKGETPGPVLLRAVRHAIERKQAERRLATLAMSDALTGLPNRALLLEHANAALDGAGAGTVGLLFLDLNRFKVVNDSLGHAAGDELLLGVADRLRAAARPGDCVARFGGDEFAVLCSGLAGPAELDGIAARLTSALAEPLRVAGTELFPSGAIGMAVTVGAGDTPERLLREADAAMYRAKTQGRPSARYDAGPDAKPGHALRTEAELHRALRRAELVVHYQPQVELAGGGEVRAVEALVRWRHPERGLVGPAEFLGTAEDTGLIRRLGAWVLDEACRQLAAWRAGGAPDLGLAVNLSPCELGDERLGERVADALAAHGLPPEALTLEVADTALLTPDPAVDAQLRGLKGLGVRIALDARVALSWATGASVGAETPGGIGGVPVDALKLDRRFVAQLGAEPPARRVVVAVLELARSLGLATVAEGLEDGDQADALAALGCTLGQGHAFAAAGPPEATEALLARAAGEGRGGVTTREPEPVRVFLCDDAPDLRDLLRAFLEIDGAARVVGEAGDGGGLTAAVRAAGADVVLLDLSMPQVDGLEALAELRTAEPGLGIVVLSGFEAHRMQAKALALGADRYLAKAAGMQDVRSTVHAVATARRGTRTLLEAAA